MSIGLIGTKIGMTREFMETGQSVPVTVIKVEKGRVLDIITQEKYKSCFEIVNQKYNTLMNPTFYNLLFNNPKLLVESSLQMYNNEICLYKEQKIIIDMIKNAIDSNSPLLLGNQMPTGQGKTFLAVPLAK